MTHSKAGGQEVAGTWQYTERYDDWWAWGLRFTPTQELAEKRWHVGSVVGVRDAHGNRLTMPYVWAFRTGDYTPPEVAGTAPAHDPGGHNAVSPQVVLTIEFDEELDITRLDEVECTLAGPGGVVSGRLAVQGAAKGAATVLRFTPDAPLVKGAYYTATVVGAVDLAGNVLAEAYEWVGGAGRWRRHPQRAGGAGAQVLRLWRPAGQCIR